MANLVARGFGSVLQSRKISGDRRAPQNSIGREPYRVFESLSLRQLRRCRPFSSRRCQLFLIWSRTSRRQCPPILLRMAQFSPDLWTPRIPHGSRNSSVSSGLRIPKKRVVRRILSGRHLLSKSPYRGSIPTAAASHSCFQRISFFR
jgi:hypothetical protein